MQPWRRLQYAHPVLRWPAKWLLLGCTTFLVLFPKPALLVRHLDHLKQMDRLPDPTEPSLAPVLARFNDFLQSRSVQTDNPDALLTEVNTFVRREIRYAWDWDVWGVAEYLPTLPEVIAKGREDCDGRAVLAAALLRARGIPAELVGDTRHMWVRTPRGETMDPLGPPVIQSRGGRVRIRWSGLIDLGPPAFGISVFPLWREMIVVAVLWLTLLPYRVDRRSALLALGLLIQGLLIIRTAGADPVRPWSAGIWLGLLSLVLPILGLWVVRLRAGRDQPAGLPSAGALVSGEVS